LLRKYADSVTAHLRQKLSAALNITSVSNRTVGWNKAFSNYCITEAIDAVVYKHTRGIREFRRERNAASQIKGKTPGASINFSLYNPASYTLDIGQNLEKRTSERNGLRAFARLAKHFFARVVEKLPGNRKVRRRKTYAR